MRFLLLSSSLLFNAACVSKASIVSSEPDKTPVIKVDFAKMLDSNFRGYLSVGDDKGYFTACDSGQDFPVIVNSALSNIYTQITSEKSSPVYIEFVGGITFPAINMPSSDALMRIDRAHHMARPKASLQCAKATHGFLFKAKGEDPYWRLNINQDRLHFATQASNSAYHIQNLTARKQTILKPTMNRESG